MSTTSILDVEVTLKQGTLDWFWKRIKEKLEN